MIWLSYFIVCNFIFKILEPDNIPSGFHFNFRVVDLGFRRCRRRTEEFSDLMYENRMGSIRLSFLFENENRMTAPSGCHFKIKMTTG